MIERRKHRLAIGTVVAMTALLVLSACGGSSKKPANANGATTLVGLFRVTAGRCVGGKITGSYFRMVSAGGSVAHGLFIQNFDSKCSDKTYSVLFPGKDGGLRTGAFQEAPAPAFDKKHNGLADLIVLPTKWFGVAFAVATSKADPQTHKATKTPTISVSGGTLTGDLSAFGAGWSDQFFNQGSPKPGGSMPGITTKVTGTYSASTGKYTLEWASQIVGGSFNKFTGVWHLEGVFVKA